MNDRWRIALLYAVMCFVWGSTWLAIRVGLQGVPPVFAAACRMLIAGVCLYLLARALRVSIPTSSAFGLLVLTQGVGQFGFNFALVYWAEQAIPSGLAAVLFAAAPLVTALSAVFVFRIERLRPINIAGLFLGLCGIAIIYWAEVVNAAHAPALRIAAMLLAVTLASNASVFAKRWGEGFEPLAIVAMGQCCGGVVLALLAGVTEHAARIHFSAVSLGALAFLIVFGSGIAYLSYFYLLRRISVTSLSLVTYISPVLAIFLGSVVLHEVLAPSTFIGAALVFIAIAMVYRRAPVAPNPIA